jgi:hypothetical protein
MELDRKVRDPSPVVERAIALHKNRVRDALQWGMLVLRVGLWAGDCPCADRGSWLRHGLDWAGE